MAMDERNKLEDETITLRDQIAAKDEALAELLKAVAKAIEKVAAMREEKDLYKAYFDEREKLENASIRCVMNTVKIKHALAATREKGGKENTNEV